MISQITLQNFRCYEETFVDFKDKRGSVRPLSFVFGDNISGKTSFLMAFGFLKHSAESLLIDQISKNRKDTKYKHTLEPFILKEHIDRHYRKGAHAPMILEFDFLSEHIVYRYKMVMLGGKLIEESLHRRSRQDFVLCYQRNQNLIVWGTRILLSKEVAKFENLVDIYHNDYSVLSIFRYLQSSCSPHHIRIHDSISDFLSVVDALYIEIDRYYEHSQIIAYITDHDLGPFAGYVDYNRLQAMESALPLMNNVLQLLFPHVAELNYRVFKVNENHYKYQIEIYFQNNDGLYSVPRDDIPKSLYTFLVILSTLVGRPVYYTYIIDDYITNFSIFALKNLYDTIFPLINASGIFTMNDNDAMNIVNPADIHIAWQEEHKFHVEQLNTVFNVQQNHNLRSRYERGLLVPTLTRPTVELSKNK